MGPTRPLCWPHLCSLSNSFWLFSSKEVNGLPVAVGPQRTKRLVMLLIEYLADMLQNNVGSFFLKWQLSLAKKFKAKQTYGVGPSENPKHAMADIRWQRIVHNDLENIVVGLIVAWASLFSTYSPRVHIVSVGFFAVARILHTVFYASEMQPHRGIAWGVAIIAIIVMVSNGTLGIFLFWTWSMMIEVMTFGNRFQAFLVLCALLSSSW